MNMASISDSCREVKEVDLSVKAQ